MMALSGFDFGYVGDNRLLLVGLHWRSRSGDAKI